MLNHARIETAFLIGRLACRLTPPSLQEKAAFSDSPMPRRLAFAGWLMRAILPGDAKDRAVQEAARPVARRR